MARSLFSWLKKKNRILKPFGRWVVLRLSLLCFPWPSDERPWLQLITRPSDYPSKMVTRGSFPTTNGGREKRSSERDCLTCFSITSLTLLQHDPDPWMSSRVIILPFKLSALFFDRRPTKSTAFLHSSQVRWVTFVPRGSGNERISTSFFRESRKCCLSIHQNTKWWDDWKTSY